MASAFSALAGTFSYFARSLTFDFDCYYRSVGNQMEEDGYIFVGSCFPGFMAFKRFKGGCPGTKRVRIYIGYMIVPTQQF